VARNRLTTQVQFLAVFASLAFFSQANAATHVVSASTNSFDCRSEDVSSGDTLIIPGGERGPLVIRNCVGTASRPITVRNDPSSRGPVVLRRSSASSGGFLLEISNSEHVVIDGTGKWNGAPSGSHCGVVDGVPDCGGCGIRVMSVAREDQVSHHVKLRGAVNRNLVLKGIDVDGQKDTLGSAGTGVNIGDSDVLWNGSNWIENITFENMCIRRVHGEGMYLGANWTDPPQQGLRRITVRNNYVHDTGRESIQLKSLWAGDGTNMNRVHNNIAKRSGQRNESGQQGACFAATGCFSEFSYNYGEDCGLQGIQHTVQDIRSSHIEGSACPMISFNNVLWRVGVGGGTTSGRGIVASANSATDVVPALTAYNNTIVQARDGGITASGDPGRQLADVRNNIIADCCSAGGSALSLHSSYVETSNQVGTVDSMRFVNARSGDFRLTESSPAVSNASVTRYPDRDYDGVPRPQGDRPDRGAFEFAFGLRPPQSPDVSVE
jgi:hypothetical protein